LHRKSLLGPHAALAKSEVVSAFRRAGTAVFAVDEVEYDGHDPTSLFELDLHH
jgi:hypothetical protein